MATNNKTFSEIVDKFRQVNLSASEKERKKAYRLEEVQENQVEDLNNTLMYKLSQEYAMNGGTNYSYLSESLTNFNIAVNMKKLTDIVTYVAVKEYNLAKTKNFKSFIKECAQCLEDKRQYNAEAQQTIRENKEKGTNKAIPPFSTNYPEDVRQIALQADKLIGVYTQNSEANNNYTIASAKDYVMYMLSNSNKTTYQGNNVFDEIQKNNALKVNFTKIYFNDKVLDKVNDDAVFIDDQFSAKQLPSNYFMLNKDYPVELKWSNDINYSDTFNEVIENLKQKYTNLNISLDKEHTENIVLDYLKNNDSVSISINPTKTVDNEENTTPNDMLQAIFQAERAYNEVTVDDINKTLNLTTMYSAKDNGVAIKRRWGAKYAKAHKSDLKMNKEVQELLINDKITTYEPLIQRAIALGATANTLKLNKYFKPEELKASCLFLESQFNKTVSLLTDIDTQWLMPYITEKIAQSFEKEVLAKNLTKEEVILRFAENEMPVQADSATTIRQLAFARPDFNNQKAIEQLKEEAEKAIEIKEQAQELENSELQKQFEAEQFNQKIEKLNKQAKAHDKLVKKLRKMPEYQKAKAKLGALILPEKTEEERQSLMPNVKNSDVENEIVEVVKPTIAEVSQPEVVDITAVSDNNIKDATAKIKQVKPETIKANIEKKLVKMILAQRDIVATKLFNKTNSLVAENKKQEANKAYTLTTLFSDLYGDIFSPKELEKNQIRIDQINEKMEISSDEEMQKNAIQLSDEYIKLTKQLTEEIYANAENIIEQDPEQKHSMIVNNLIRDEKKLMQVRFIEDIQKYHNVKIAKPQIKIKNDEEKEI